MSTLLLHYQFQDRHTQTELNSLLIDAGGHRGASDITRTYVATGSNYAKEARGVFTHLLDHCRVIKTN